MTVATGAVSERIAGLRNSRVDDFCPDIVGHRDSLYLEAFEKYAELPMILRYAYGFANVLHHKRILIRRDDLLAGFFQQYLSYATLPQIYSEDYIKANQRVPGEMDCDMEISKIIEYHGLAEDSAEVAKLRRFRKGFELWLFKHFENGAFMPDFPLLLQVGFSGLQEQCAACLAAAENQQQIDTLKAMQITLEAAVAYIKRYEALAAELAEQETNAENKKNLLRIQAACANLAVAPPQSFFAAVQMVWFAQEMLNLESFPDAISLGRMDKYLDPFYAKDESAGIMDRVQAQEIIEALWLKFTAIIHGYQNVTLGGYDDDGSYLANTITSICLEATRKLKPEQPQLSMRWNEQMPDWLWEEVLATIQTGAGFPSIFNDDICISAKQRSGISAEDARDYAVIGCVEIAIPGREYCRADALRVNWGKIMEMMMSGDELLNYPHDLAEIDCFDSFLDWYHQELLANCDLAMDYVSMIGSVFGIYWPTPFASTLFSGCMEKGMDVACGGTVYNNAPCNVAGVATVTDSLIAIKKAVFEDKIITLPQFAAALAANYEGYEELRQYVLQCPKFGNDIDEADAIYARLINAFIDNCRHHGKNSLGGAFQPGLYTVEDHSKMGCFTGALPDGRLAKTAMSNAVCPVQGADVNGPTAVINSILKARVGDAANGMVMDLKFHPAFFEKKSHRDALKSLLITYFGRGGLEVQINVVDRATLLDAQNHPELYPDLVVRVSGFSAYFVNLWKTTQDEIIARTEYGAI